MPDDNRTRYDRIGWIILAVVAVVVGILVAVSL